jgi:MFS family permease
MAYALLIASAFLFDLALNLPVGTMPLALSGDGATRTAVALAMSAGMCTALVASLPLGALADRIGRLATLRAATALGSAALLALAFVHGPLGGGIVLGIRSIAVVACMTAQFAYAGELASEGRAVSTVATLGMIGNLTFALAPALSVVLWQHGIGREQYAWATVVALAGGALTFALPAKHDIRPERGGARILLRTAWLPAMAFSIAGSLQGGVNGSLAVLTFHERGIINGAAIFSAGALAAFALRYPAGRLVDRFGPRVIAWPVVIAQVVGCILAAQAFSLTQVLVAGAFLGTAWAAVVPVTVGLLFENSSRETRGAAMGAYNLAFSGGAALGALLGAVATLIGPGYPLAIITCAVAPALALPFVLRSRVPVASPHVTYEEQLTSIAAVPIGGAEA